MEGRLEIYYNGRWGTVCNDGWNDKYVSLVCAQMGLGSLGEIADFGAGTGSIFLEKVVCSLNNTVLASCAHYGVGVIVQCNHNDDVGLKCDGMYIVLLLEHKRMSIFNLRRFVYNIRSSTNVSTAKICSFLSLLVIIQALQYT